MRQVKIGGFLKVTLEVIFIDFTICLATDVQIELKAQLLMACLY